MMTFLQRRITALEVEAFSLVASIQRDLLDGTLDVPRAAERLVEIRAEIERLRREPDIVPCAACGQALDVRTATFNRLIVQEWQLVERGNASTVRGGVAVILCLDCPKWEGVFSD
jgi:hypothetical protein